MLFHRMKRFTRGQFCTYENDPCYVNFISEYYITLCLHEWAKPPEEAEHSKRPYRQVNLCVCSDQWGKILPDPEKPYNRFSTEYAEIVENL